MKTKNEPLICETCEHFRFTPALVNSRTSGHCSRFEKELGYALAPSRKRWINRCGECWAEQDRDNNTSCQPMIVCGVCGNPLRVGKEKDVTRVYPCKYCCDLCVSKATVEDHDTGNFSNTEESRSLHDAVKSVLTQPVSLGISVEEYSNIIVRSLEPICNKIGNINKRIVAMENRLDKLESHTNTESENNNTRQKIYRIDGSWYWYQPPKPYAGFVEIVQKQDETKQPSHNATP